MEYEVILQTIIINDFIIAKTIKKALLEEGYKLTTNMIINNGQSPSESITISRIEKF